MPTNQKRHTCTLCGVKRVQKYMHTLYMYSRNRYVWACNDCTFNANDPLNFDARGVRIPALKQKKKKKNVKCPNALPSDVLKS